MRKKEIKVSKGLGIFLVCLIDILILHAGYVLSYILKFGFILPMVNFDPYYALIPLITITYILLSNIYGLYSISNKSIGDIIYSIILSLIILQLITITGTFFIRKFAFPRSIFIMAFALQSSFLILWRYYIYKLYKKIYSCKNIMFIGKLEEAEPVIKKIIMMPEDWIDVKYIIEPESYITAFSHIPEVDIIYICGSIKEDIKNELIEKAVAFNKKIYIVPKLQNIMYINSKVVNIDDVPLISLAELKITNEQKLIKRICDLIISIIAIIILSPLFLISILLVKLTSEGPIIYKQTRITEGNKEFSIYKFRTMYIDAENRTGPILASENDPRITRAGRLLRAVRLDELPQLFNVIKGDMSIIGPRPERPFFVDKFQKQYPEYNLRHSVKAGITGLAQVMGKYSTDVSDKIKYDILYIRNYSFLLDIKIIFLTIKILFMKESSNGLKDEKDLDKLLQSMNYNVYNEAGVTMLSNDRGKNCE